MSVDILKLHCASIESTPFGVIVIRLTDHREICVYHPEVYRAPRVPTLFTPRVARIVKVARGRLIHAVYIVEPVTATLDHLVYVMIDDELLLSKQRVGLVPATSRVYKEGMSWEVAYGVLQEVVPCSLCITEGKLQQQAPASMQSRVVVPVGEEVDLTPLLTQVQRMWEIVEDALL
jgi:hypothetical protein